MFCPCCYANERQRPASVWGSLRARHPNALRSASRLRGTPVQTAGASGSFWRRLEFLDQLAEVIALPQHVEVRLVQMVERSEADRDGGAQGGDRLVGEGGSLRGGHAGLRLRAQPGQQRQRPRALEMVRAVEVLALDPPLQGVSQVGGSRSGVAGAGVGGAPEGVAVAQALQVAGNIRTGVGHLLAERLRVVERGKCLALPTKAG
jgi:hypothetical protein